MSNDYAGTLVSASDHIAEALVLLRKAHADGDTAIKRAAVRPLIAPLAALHAQLFELASAAQEPHQ